MKKRVTIITALTLSSIIFMTALAGCNTSCSKQPAGSPSESIETSLIDGSAVAIIETEINGSKVTETSMINTTSGTSASSRNSDKNTSETMKDSRDPDSNDSSNTQSTTTTQATTESGQNSTKATNTPKPTNTPVPTTAQKNTPTPTKAPTATPKPTSTPKPTATPTTKPTNTPVPTATPTPEPTATPTPEPTPTSEPTEEPEETDPEIGYAILKVKVTSSIYDNDEDATTHQEVDYFEVEGYTSSYHSTNPDDYNFDGREIGNQLDNKYGDEYVEGYTAYAVEVVRFTN